MKSLQIAALKSCERFVKRVQCQNTTRSISDQIPETEVSLQSEAVETLQIIQRAIVWGELQPDLRLDMLTTLKRCLIALNIAPRFDTGLPTGKLADTVFERGFSSYDLAAEVQRLIGRAEK